MSETTYIPFTEWLPDLQDTNNQGLEIARNVLPKRDGFQSFPSFVRESTNTIDGDAKGLFSAEDSAGTQFIFAGDEAKLYRYTASQTFDDVSKAGGYVNTDLWDFTLFESQVIATNYNDEIQEFTIGTSALFDDLSASAPKARYIASVRDFVMAADTVDATDGAVPFRVWRCARGDPSDWVASAATQAGFQDIYDTGPIRGLVGGAFGIAFTSGGVHRLTYVGSPVVFQRDEIGNGIGCGVPGSVVKRIESRGELALIYFRSEDGFAVTDGSTVREIGNERVNQWFYDRFDQSREEQLTAGIFGLKDSVVWSFPSVLATGQNDSYIAFSYSNNRWSYGEIDVEQLGQTSTPAVFLDEITDLVDDTTTLVDSSSWNASGSVFGAIDHEGYFGTFVGPALEPEFVTGNYRLGPGRARVGRIWPDCDGTVQTQVRYGETTNQMGSYSPASTIRRGFTSHRSFTGKNNLSAIRMNSSGAFTEAKGMLVEFYGGGV